LYLRIVLKQTEVHVGLRDLTGMSPQQWDAAIAAELQEADIGVSKFREYDTPGCWQEHTFQGVLGQWVFSRATIVYSFWGAVPLATAEVIAADKACAEGCMPGQWLPIWGERPDPAAAHAKFADCIAWVADGLFLVKDTGQSDQAKEVLQNSANWQLRFVADPSDPKEGGKPFIQTYTFFTLEALKNFVAIAKHHRLDFRYTF
jgi:hypothetical protein